MMPHTIGSVMTTEHAVKHSKPKDPIADAVRKQRETKELSLREVAALAGVSYNTVFAVERGKASDSAAVKVMKALGIGAKQRLALMMSSVRRLAAA